MFTCLQAPTTPSKSQWEDTPGRQRGSETPGATPSARMWDATPAAVTPGNLDSTQNGEWKFRRGNRELGLEIKHRTVHFICVCTFDRPHHSWNISGQVGGNP